MSRLLIESKCRELLAGRQRREQDIHAFQEMVLQGGNAIREAVNSGERTFRDVLQLLESADRFREWLQQQEPDVEVVTSYYRDATAETWVTTLPAKALRWSVALGVGTAVGGLGLEGILVSGALAAADMFVLERLVAGWRPTQFVEAKLKPFVGLRR